MFWLVAASLTLVVTALTVAPLLRRQRAEPAAREAYDVEIYRAQLAELDADLGRGSIAVSDAGAARAEIGRRLLRAADGAKAPGVRRQRLAPAAGLAVALFVPVSAFLVYDRVGSPELSDQPLVARLDGAPDVSDVPALLARVEQRLAASPGDADGWGVVAPIYLQQGDGEKAAEAFRNALRLAPPTAQRLAGLGEALVQASGGTVTPEAEAQFRQSLELDPAWPPARFFLALKLSQDGRAAEARDAWNALLAVSPADAPWLPVARAALADAQASIGDGGDAGEAAQAAAILDLPAQDRQAMIEGMVSGLADRLRQAPGDLEGWKRLVRSYEVLGERDKAEAASVEAARAFRPGSAERREIVEFASGLGLADPEVTAQ